MLQRRAFTLIELLVVIAIIAVLSVVVILSLNPAELLRQSRDSNRLSDLATMSEVLNIYAEDVGGSMGNTTTTYISLVDTSSACANQGLPSLPSGWVYQCVSSTSTRNTDGTGWIPLALKNISSGSPLGSLPVDPVNTSSTGLYYTYTASGSQYEVTSLLESQKYKQQFATKSQVPNYPEVVTKGTTFALSPLWSASGLVGYWNFDGGAGSSTIDQSGNENTGSWGGTAAGNNGTYYTGGKVGPYAGYFDGITDWIQTGYGSILDPTSSVTVAAWINSTNVNASFARIEGKGWCNSSIDYFLTLYNGPWIEFTANIGGSQQQAVGITTLQNNQWYFVAGSYDGSSIKVYLNGALNGSTTVSGALNNDAGSYPSDIGACNDGSPFQPFPGTIDDVRVYSRALSAAEIQALYNAEK